MPTIHVNRERLYRDIGKQMTDEEFDELCFQFGIELDEVTSERNMVSKEQGKLRAESLSDEIIYRIEVPANRYDLLCHEGLVRALRAYLYSEQPAQIQSQHVSTNVVSVSANVSAVRPFIACAVLRGFRMTQHLYDSLIDLQDKLHGGLGRKRTLVSIGTYDLDTLSGPFSYDAVAPEDISFAPLNRPDQIVNGHELMTILESDLKLRKFLQIIREEPRYPVLRDCKGIVMSVPPIINGDSSKISLSTRNIFIDVTGTDRAKVMTALNILVTSFAQFCESVESVTLKNSDGQIEVTPNLAVREELLSVSYVNKSLGLMLTPQEICKLLELMLLSAAPVSDDHVAVSVPPMRSDIVHSCDIMEDVAIAYGFNNIPARVPVTGCFAAMNPLNKFGDQLRREVALCGYSEVLAFSLCSYAENFAHLRRADPGNEAVVLANPKTIEFEVVHTSLIPSMLKTLASNKKMPLPIKIFQVADVVLLDPSHEVGARNQRRLCALICSMSSGLEIIHGLLDRLMLMTNNHAGENVGYHIKASNSITYFHDH